MNILHPKLQQDIDHVLYKYKHKQYMETKTRSVNEYVIVDSICM